MERERKIKREQKMSKRAGKNEGRLGKSSLALYYLNAWNRLGVLGYASQGKV